jgi:murein DD-endopeptidase MepM/ murein hydrolase activator NlpD
VTLRARAALAAVAGSGAAAVALLAPGAGVVSGAAPTGGTAPVAPVAPGFVLLDPRVSPAKAYVAGRRVQVSFGVDAVAPIALKVDVVREATRRPVVTFALPVAAPGSAQRVEWDGLTGAGKVAPNGRYRMRVVAPDGTARNAGRVELRSHIYPVRGRHADRGPIGQFGVGRNGGRTHEGFDVDAACGTPLVAARGGVVTRADYDPVLYGNLVIIRGERTQRDYWYAHLLRTPRLKAGDRVSTGQRIGSIGATGNARTIGCHLHFEIRSNRKPIDPAPDLRAWDGWS